MSQNIRKALGDSIRTRRLALHLSQEQLADAAGLHRTYVGAVERGERNISLDNIVAMAGALNSTASDLLCEVM